MNRAIRIAASASAACLFVAATAQERELEIHVLMQQAPAYRIHAQQWGARLQQLGIRAVFRSAAAGDRIIIEDADRDGRQVTRVIGGMTPEGLIQFGDRRYSHTDPGPLVGLFEELRQFGAMGPVEERPTWGLTDEQFAEVLSRFSQPVTEPVSLRNPVEAIESITATREFRVVYTDAARDRIASLPAGPDQPGEFAGLSSGTVLAAALSSFGLGFRPLLERAGGYRLEVDAGGEADNLYPVGWKGTEPITTAVPQYLRSIRVDIETAQVDALIGVLAERMELPALYSSWHLHSAGIRPDSLEYTRRPGRISPALLLQSVGDRTGMGFDVRTDEAGKSFLWCTTRAENLAFRNRFAKSNPRP